jgi:DNA-directed RNA polymerase subunit beta'
MILTVLPVIPPNLRPMVQLDGGRFATSDLNDLYRRVINRNNRLKRLIELGAPEIIIRNEKRMLQEATDALIDNGRRGRAVNGSGNHKLKSLSDMLKGKQGRFRQNLLGKRVDYSGRSVIVVGPDLKLNQCGLPKKMALELFKPFVMRKLVERNFAHNIKSAKRIVERVRPEVWDVLEEVIKDHPVLLNRAPTLHRLGIQAFDAVLVEGSAIQIHPLVCTAFNADFDGDQMAVHVPLSKAAQNEARTRMMSTRNLLSPASGEPIVNPTKDMVLGCYYLTSLKEDARGVGTVFSTFDEALQALELEKVSLHARVYVGIPQHMLDQDEIPTSAGVVSRDDLVKLPNSSKAYGIETTPGRVVFNMALPASVPYKNKIQDKGTLKDVVAEVYALFGQERTAEVADEIKRLGFRYATHSGITMSVADITIPKSKPEIVQAAEEEVLRVQEQYEEGLITDEERYRKAVDVWTQASQDVEEAVTRSLDPHGPIYMMSVSGAAKGGFTQVRQIAGMRGLMADPSGKIIDLPILSNFREGLSVLEYFISTHGARKGLADTALRTAESGYLTRRLIDVAQDVIIREEDCGALTGIQLRELPDQDTILEPLHKRIIGRLTAKPLYHPVDGTLVVDASQAIDQKLALEIADALSTDPDAAVEVRSPLTCVAKHGLCRSCYGWSLATGLPVELGEAVGIIAAQSIGEPGTQLTMRTFHTGGVAGSDITQGLPRVEELFEARVPKEVAVISEIDGIVTIERDDNEQRITVASTEEEATERHALEKGYSLAVASGELVQPGTVLAKASKRGKKQVSVGEIVARTAGRVTERDGQIIISPEPLETRTYTVSALARLRVSDGQFITAGTQLTEGSSNPQDILRVMGREDVQMFLVEEVQKVYKTQGVTINDKHIEVIVRQMLRKVRVDTPGDTDLLPGEMVDRFKYEGMNAAVLAQGGEPATATTVLLGVTKASLTTDSFLAAASFQDTTKVLTDAAIAGQVDRLVGLKENVIIGKLIPAGTGLLARQQQREALISAEEFELADVDGELLPEELGLEDGLDGAEPEPDLLDVGATGELDQSDIA